ncbi:NADH-quinone oxidoreductase subunit N [Stetteria hydrogenophila]
MALSPAEASLALIHLALAASLAVPIACLLGWRGAARPLAAVGAAAALSSALVLAYAVQGGPVSFHGGLVVHNAFTAFMLVSAGVVGLLALWASGEAPDRWPTYPAFYGLVPLALYGLYYVAGSADALAFLAAWLLVSVASYVMTSAPGDSASRAAAVRYVLVGLAATLLLAMWVAIHAGIASTASLEGWMDLATCPPGGLTIVASTLLLAGVGFKLGIVPFHWWLPSVYARADGRVMGFIDSAVKLGFIAFLAHCIYSATPQLAPLLAALSVATMTYGNLAALTTRDLRGILAYSSIAHVGYILAALAGLAYLQAANPEEAALALGAVALHATAYALAKSTLFPMAGELGGSLERLRGLAGRDPYTAASAGILLLSLLGVPPLLGFWGKLYMLLAVIKYSPLLAVAFLVNSGVSAAYYIPAVRELWSREGEPGAPSSSLRRAITAAALATTALGLIAPALLAASTP